MEQREERLSLLRLSRVVTEEDNVKPNQYHLTIHPILLSASTPRGMLPVSYAIKAWKTFKTMWDMDKQY